ncbi:MAG: hypothetical protein ABEK16_04825 [Candidatus Nanohalobium sp.]
MSKEISEKIEEMPKLRREAFKTGIYEEVIDALDTLKTRVGKGYGDSLYSTEEIAKAAEISEMYTGQVLGGLKSDLGYLNQIWDGGTPRWDIASQEDWEDIKEKLKDNLE